MQVLLDEAESQPNLEEDDRHGVEEPRYTDDELDTRDTDEPKYRGRDDEEWHRVEAATNRGDNQCDVSTGGRTQGQSQRASQIQHHSEVLQSYDGFEGSDAGRRYTSYESFLTLIARNVSILNEKYCLPLVFIAYVENIRNKSSDTIRVQPCGKLFRSVEFLRVDVVSRTRLGRWLPGQGIPAGCTLEQGVVVWGA